MSIAFLSPKWSNLTIQMMIHHVLGIKKKKLFTLSLGTKFWVLLWNNELSFSLINKCNLCLRVLGGLEVREVQILVDLKEHNHNGQINDAILCHGPLNAISVKRHQPFDRWIHHHDAKGKGKHHTGKKGESLTWFTFLSCRSRNAILPRLSFFPQRAWRARATKFT